MGKICPVVGDLTMKAPVLGNALFESTNPYVIAEAFGDTSSNDAMTTQMIRRRNRSVFSFYSPCFWEAGSGSQGGEILHPACTGFQARWGLTHACRRGIRRSRRFGFCYLIGRMPVISMFYGIIVLMYYFDNRGHKQPHIHVQYNDEERSSRFRMAKLSKVHCGEPN